MLRFSVLIPACLLWLFALSGNAFAQAEITVDSGYAALDQFLNHLDSLQASFSQSVRDGRNRVIDTSAGTLMIKRPGKFRWDYAKPNAQTIVSDGGRIWLYDPELQQVTINRVDLTLSGTPAMLLSGNGTLRDNFEIEHVERRGELLVINLTPKSSGSDFRLVQIALRKDLLDAMSLTDKLGQSTVLQFTQIKRNPALTDAQFRFNPPAGVDIIDNSSKSPGKNNAQ